MEFEDLAAEQWERAQAGETAEELIAFARQEGIELTDEQLGAIAGGRNWCRCVIL